jgi:hypothetical protein
VEALLWSVFPGIKPEVSSHVIFNLFLTNINHSHS